MSHTLLFSACFFFFFSQYQIQNAYNPNDAFSFCPLLWWGKGGVGGRMLLCPGLSLAFFPVMRERWFQCVFRSYEWEMLVLGFILCWMVSTEAIALDQLVTQSSFTRATQGVRAAWRWILRQGRQTHTWAQSETGRTDPTVFIFLQCSCKKTAVGALAFEIPLGPLLLILLTVQH